MKQAFNGQWVLPGKPLYPTPWLHKALITLISILVYHFLLQTFFLFCSTRMTSCVHLERGGQSFRTIQCLFVCPFECIFFRIPFYIAYMQSLNMHLFCMCVHRVFEQNFDCLFFFIHLTCTVILHPFTKIQVLND